MSDLADRARALLDDYRPCACAGDPGYHEWWSVREACERERAIVALLRDALPLLERPDDVAPSRQSVTVRDLIMSLLADHAPDSRVYVGKGMGPLRSVDSVVGDDGYIYVVVKP